MERRPLPFKGRLLINPEREYARGATEGQVLQKAVIRGGNWDNEANAGVFAFNANNAPSNANDNIGFRCGRGEKFQV